MISTPILTLFDSGRIKTLLKRMGHDEQEVIEHRMSKSLQRAQDKLAENGLSANSSKLVEVWFNGIK